MSVFGGLAFMAARVSFSFLPVFFYHVQARRLAQAHRFSLFVIFVALRGEGVWGHTVLVGGKGIAVHRETKEVKKKVGGTGSRLVRV